MPLVSSGVEHGNLRELALARMRDFGTQCRDVRTREVGIQEIHHKVKPYEVGMESQKNEGNIFSPKLENWGKCWGILSRQFAYHPPPVRTGYAAGVTAPVITQEDFPVFYLISLGIRHTHKICH